METASSSWAFGKYFFIFVIPFIEPQLAGMLGAFAYLIVRHELQMASMKISSVLIVVFFGWMGAWATVHIFAEHAQIADVWIKISSAAVGFLSYDAMLMFGRNTNSVLGFILGIVKSTTVVVIERAVTKWKS